jgi:DNA-binding transcriptional regulator YiaG
MSVNEAIKKLRLLIGLEQSEFGQELEVTTGTVCNWEAGRRSPRLPKIRKMVELARKHKIKMNIEDFLS